MSKDRENMGDMNGNNGIGRVKWVGWGMGGQGKGQSMESDN